MTYDCWGSPVKPGMMPSTGKTMLLTDAEIPKNIPQNLICGDLADYAAEVVDCFSDVLGSEVCRQAAGKAFADAEEGGPGI